MAQIPLQHATSGRMPDVGERDAHLRGELPHPGHRGGGEVAGPHQGGAGDVGDDAGVDAALGGVPPRGHWPTRSGDYLRDTQRRLALGDGLGGQVLQFDLRLAEGGVAELEDADRRGARGVGHHEVLILLAAQFGDVAGQPEVLVGQPADVLDGEGRRGQLVVGEEVEQFVGHRWFGHSFFTADWPPKPRHDVGSTRVGARPSSRPESRQDVSAESRITYTVGFGGASDSRSSRRQLHRTHGGEPSSAVDAIGIELVEAISQPINEKA